MKPKLLIDILSIFILITVSCNNSKSPTSSDEMKFPKQLTSSGKDFISYWSPNGEHIAFLSSRNTYNPNAAAILFELWLMKNDGSSQHPIISIDDLYEGSITITNVSWSKDSNDMLVQIYTPMGSEIWRVTLDGIKTRLSSTDDWAERPEYSPDGSKIAFIIQGPNPPQGSPVYRLYVSNTDFLEPVLIEKSLIQYFSWKSDNQGLIYSLYDRPNENYELWKSSIDGTEKYQFSKTLLNEENPSYSIDDKYIAFSDQNALYITPTQIFQPKKLIDKARLTQWIPNSNLILVSCEQTVDNESYWSESWVVDLEGNIIKKIAEGKPTSVNFSSNGKYFVYSLDGNFWLDQFIK